jgi:TRAP transporter TAXI family solute receptor
MRRRPLLLLPMLAPFAAAAQAPLRFYTAGAGSAFLPYGEGLTAFLAKRGVAVTVERSAGSLENLAKVQDDSGAIGTAFLGSAVDALRGTQAAGGRVHDKVRALFPMYETSFHVGALRASGIASVPALAGKKVGAGPAGGPAETFLRALLAARGLSVQVVSGDPGELARQLVAGEIDALWQGAVVPIPSLVAAQAAGDVVVFGLTAEEVAAVRGRMPYLAESAAAPGMYKGQAAPILSFAAWNFVVGNAALPEAAAEALVAAAMSATDPRAEIHPLAGGTMPANAGANTVLPWHPAAARFFTARGVRLPATTP